MATRAKALVHEAAQYDFSELTEQPLVYFVQVEDGGPVKLGVTAHIADKYTTLQEANPHRLALIGVIRTADKAGAFALERKLKRRFHTWNIHHEWYRAAGKILDYVAKHAEVVPVKYVRHTDKTAEAALLQAVDVLTVDPPSALLRPKDLAARLGTSVVTVRRWTKQGLIPAMRLGPQVIRYDLFEVAKAIDEATRVPKLEVEEPTLFAITRVARELQVAPATVRRYVEQFLRVKAEILETMTTRSLLTPEEDAQRVQLSAGRASQLESERLRQLEADRLRGIEVERLGQADAYGLSQVEVEPIAPMIK